jgi:hypothetical protein
LTRVVSNFGFRASNFDVTGMQLTIDRFEGDRAVLRTNAGQDPAVQSEGLNTAGQELVVPKREVPATAREGDALTVNFSTDASATDERAQRAKEMLNQILGADGA